MNSTFSGFPKIPILSRPWTEILIFFILFYSGFLLPIIISSAICLCLICKKKRLFQNEVSDLQEPENQSNHQNDIVFQKSDNEQQLEIQAKNKQEEKIMLQIAAAERSLKTNGFIVISFAIVFCIIMAVSKETRVYFHSIAFALIKSALPLLTTIANFGTIQHVARQYWNYFQQQNPFVFIHF